MLVVSKFWNCIFIVLLTRFKTVRWLLLSNASNNTAFIILIALPFLHNRDTLLCKCLANVHLNESEELQYNKILRKIQIRFKVYVVNLFLAFQLTDPVL